MVLSRIRNKAHFTYWTLHNKLHSKRKLRNVLVFESKPDLSDNTKAVFDEMLRRNLNKDYKLVWLLFESDERKETSLPNVYHLPVWDPQAKYYSSIAKAKIFCNAFLEKENPNQLCFYLSHGTALKDVRHSYRLPDWVDYCIAASPDLEEFHAKTMSFDPKRTIGLGFPRNDALLQKPIPLQKILHTDCEKIVVWYPTFRQHNCVKYTTVRTPIPLLHDMECAQKLNDAAISVNTLIVIKPHFVQDTQYIKQMNLSNIQFIDDRFFADNEISSYQFVGSCDGLISDYSSIYYDYTLCDKPIAAVWEDVEEYKQSPGLVDNYEHLTQGMEKVYTLDELISFIGRVSAGTDLLQTERRKIRDYTNIATDGKNSQRVVDFILGHIDTITHHRR